MLVNFKGALRELCPDPITVKAKTPRQVLEALKTHPRLDPKKTHLRYEAKIEGLVGVGALDSDWGKPEITIICTKVIQRLSGAGGSIKNPVVRLVIGIILIVVAYYTGYYEAGAEGTAMLFSQAALSMGIAMAAGALVEILAPAPSENDKASHLASTYGNTVKSGTPIAIILGEHLWGGHYISYNVDSNTIKQSAEGANGLSSRVLTDQGSWVYADGRGYWDELGLWVMGEDGGYWDEFGLWVTGPGGGYWEDSGVGTNDVWISGGYLDGRGYWDEDGVTWIKGWDGGYWVDNRWVKGAGGGYWDASGDWVPGPVTRAEVEAQA